LILDSGAPRPDVMVLAPEWPERALLRAQLIERGHEVIAISEWPMPRLYRRPEMTPRVFVVDLRGLPQPREALDEIPVVMPRDRVLVLTALGTLAPDAVHRLGFHVVERPITVGQIVAVIEAVLS
jgi:hypothetical protein